MQITCQPIGIIHSPFTELSGIIYHLHKILQTKLTVIPFLDNRVDVLDGTPLLDLKPFVPTFEGEEKFRTGWKIPVKQSKTRAQMIVS